MTTPKIDPADLVPMDLFIGSEPIKIDLVYADANHPRNIFDEAIYHADARFWAHKDLATVTLLTARTLQKKYGYTLELKDCLRTTDAQESMGKTEIVRANSDWLEEPNRMVSPSGHGAHPRGMAIDVCLLKNGNEVDMGTPFDHMDKTSARSYNGFSVQINQNRLALEETYMMSARSLNHDFLALPAEWWDFRFPRNTYNQYAPLSDSDLPPQIQMTNKTANDIPDFPSGHFESLAESIIALVDKHHENL